MENDAGFTTPVFEVKDWRDLVSKEEMAEYLELDELVNALYEKAQNEKLPDSKIREIAETIQKAKNEQKKIIYKYDFQKFVDDLFDSDEGEDEEILQDKVKTPWFHIEMYNAYQQSKRICVVCPRGHGKSSAARLYILHQLLNRQTRYVIIIGSSEDMAGQNLRWIRDQLTDNPNVLQIYGDLYNKRKWAETEFVTASKIKITAKGAGQKLRGANEKGRPDLIYIDDIEYEDLVANKENRWKLAKWFKEAVLPMKSKNGRFIMTGTILDPDSLLKNVALNLFRDHIKWKVLWYQALNKDKNGKEFALWPEMKSLAELRALKEVDPVTFAQEYQNNPTSGEQGVFRINWFEWFSRKDVRKQDNGKIFIYEKRVNTMLHTDLAISERDGADFTVLGISAMNEAGDLFWPEIMRFRSSDIFDIIGEIFRMVHDWYIDMMTMETIVFQKAVKRQIEREMEIRKKYFHIEEMKRSGTTKMARFKGLQSPLKAGKMHFMEEHRPYIEEEFLKITATRLPRHDDVMDVVSDGWEKQEEYRSHQKKSQPDVNTLAWAEKMGYIPKVNAPIRIRRGSVR
ncbi:hypothetical protein KKH82_05475 [Patescibacteria group bacterium]|nr:hypothetical protein [Patescibacteria group bacterium]